jgi:hypothetical protein
VAANDASAWMEPFPRFLKQAFLWIADKLIIDRQLAPPINSFRTGLGLRLVSQICQDYVHG